jgi:hypothetical protein
MENLLDMKQILLHIVALTMFILLMPGWYDVESLPTRMPELKDEQVTGVDVVSCDGVLPYFFLVSTEYAGWAFLVNPVTMTPIEPAFAYKSKSLKYVDMDGDGVIDIEGNEVQPLCAYYYDAIERRLVPPRKTDGIRQRRSLES